MMMSSIPLAKMMTLLLLASIILDYGTALSISRRSSSLLRHLQSTDPSASSTIPLFFSLGFYDDNTAAGLESRNKQNDAVMAFCEAVQTQVGGSQVKLAAIQVGLIINAVTGIDECNIVATKRVYGAPADPGLFSLELAVTQTVQASGGSLDQLTSLVQVGFNGATGGRARFMELLQGTDEFAGLSEVKPLDALSTSSPTPSPTSVPVLPPTRPPTISPTQSPTLRPTLASPPPPTSPPTSPPTPRPTSPPTPRPSPRPTTRPTDEILLTNDPSPSPSLRGTSNPTAQSRTNSPTVTAIVPSNSPSFQPVATDASFPSLDPTFPTSDQSSSPTNPTIPPPTNPSISPTTNPTFPPTNPPTVTQAFPPFPQATDSPSSERTAMSPLLIAAIVGSIVATLVFCCFGIGCFCWKDDRPSNEQNSNERRMLRRSGEHPDNNSGSLNFLPVVPNIVQLDDDNQSLANTTLGEHTAGRRPPGKKRLIAFDSFDDNSLYTSPYQVFPSRQFGDESNPLKKGGPKYPLSVLAGAGAQNPNFPFGTNIASPIAEAYDSDSSSRPDQSSVATANYSENLFSDAEDGLLGAIPNSSPLANKIEEMVSSALDVSFSSESSKSVIIDMSDANAPFDESGHNIFLFDDTDEDELDDSNRNGFFAQKEERDNASVADSSVINKVENITPATPGDDGKSKSSSQYATPNGASPDSNSSSSKDYASPGGLVQESKNNIYRSQILNTSPPEEVAKHFGLELDDSSDCPEDENSIFKSIPVTSVTVKSAQPLENTHIKVTRRGFMDSPTGTLSQSTSSSQESPEGNDQVRRKTPTAVERVTSNPAIRSSIAGRPSTPKKMSLSIFSSGSLDSEEDNTFLFEALEGALGPRSESCDMESMGGRSECSSRSAALSRDGSRRSRGHMSRGRSTGSRSSRRGRKSHYSEEEKLEITTKFKMAPRSLEHDLNNLERQLESLKKEAKKTGSRQDIPPSLRAMAIGGAGPWMNLTKPHVSTKQRVVIVVPPGKLGIVLANRRDGVGTIVAEVKSASALSGALSPGDKLVAIDGVDVTRMVVSDITSIMAEKSTQERHLTVITSSKVKPLEAETKIAFP